MLHDVLMLLQAPDVSAEFGKLLALVLGSLGVGLTELFKRLVVWITSEDAAIVAFIKPVQPLIALALGLLLPHLHFLHQVLPSGDVLASAPIGTLVVIVIRELIVRLFPSQA